MATPLTTSLLIDLNGSTPAGVDNITSGYVAGTTVALFSSSPTSQPYVTTGDNKGNQKGDLTSLTLQLSAGDSLSLNTTTDFNIAAGPGPDQYILSYTGTKLNYTDAQWTTALDNLKFTSTNTYTDVAFDHITIAAVTNRGGNPYTSSNVGYDDVTCFYPGTLIRTPAGEVAVETLKPGDLVLTHDGREVPIAWLGRQTVSTRFGRKDRVLPIRIKAGALAENVPARDLLVSPGHGMFFDGVLAIAGALVNDTSIVRETDVPTVFTYYHIEVADHSLILAEGAPAETFLDDVDRERFDNWSEYEALYPEGKIGKPLPYPRAKSRRQIPVALRVALAARAEAIGAVETGAAVA